MSVEGSVVRSRSTALGTPGVLSLPSLSFSCDTLELVWLDNLRGLSCIKPDAYSAWVWHSPTFNRNVVRLEDKHGRKDCLLHAGNWASVPADVDGDGVKEFSNIRGCTLVGRGFGELLRKDGKKQWGIKSSSPTLTALIDALRDRMQPGGFHRLRLTYSWADEASAE